MPPFVKEREKRISFARSRRCIRVNRAARTTPLLSTGEIFREEEGERSAQGGIHKEARGGRRQAALGAQCDHTPRHTPDAHTDTGIPIGQDSTSCIPFLLPALRAHRQRTWAAAAAGAATGTERTATGTSTAGVAFVTSEENPTRRERAARLSAAASRQANFLPTRPSDEYVRPGPGPQPSTR